MARQAEKTQAKSNVAKIAFLRKAAVGVNALFIVVRLLLCYKSTTKKTFFLYIITNIAAGLIQYNLERLGSPRYSADGSLRSAGEDLNQAGLTEYLTDIVYLTWIVYVTVALITDYGWLLFLAVPVYAVAKAWPLVQPLLAQARQQARQAQRSAQSAGTGAGDDNVDEMSKRQAKLKARQEKHGVRIKA